VKTCSLQSFLGLIWYLEIISRLSGGSQPPLCRTWFFVNSSPPCSFARSFYFLLTFKLLFSFLFLLRFSSLTHVWHFPVNCNHTESISSNTWCHMTYSIFGQKSLILKYRKFLWTQKRSCTTEAERRDYLKVFMFCVHVLNNHVHVLRVCECPGHPYRHEVHHRPSCTDSAVDRAVQRSDQLLLSVKLMLNILCPQNENENPSLFTEELIKNIWGCCPQSRFSAFWTHFLNVVRSIKWGNGSGAHWFNFSDDLCFLIQSKVHK